MDDLTTKLKNIQKNAKIYNLIQNRLKEFQAIDKKNDEELFSELAFCILTANFNAERTIKIQQSLGKSFLVSSEEELSNQLRSLGHRYPNTRAKYIVEARNKLQELKTLLDNKNEIEIRAWLAKNIKGLGMKESSHFLRNIGFKNVAIIDFHILDILERHRLANKPKTLTPKKYIEIEQILTDIAKKLDISLAELDLRLWYLETRKVLK